MIVKDFKYELKEVFGLQNSGTRYNEKEAIRRLKLTIRLLWIINETGGTPKVNTSNETEQTIDNISSVLDKLQKQIKVTTTEYFAYEYVMKQMKNRGELQHKDIEHSIDEVESKIEQIRKCLQASRDSFEEDTQAYIDSDLQSRKFNEYFTYRNYELSRDLRKAADLKKEKNMESSNLLEAAQAQTLETIDIFLNDIDTEVSISDIKLKTDKVISEHKVSTENYISEITKLKNEKKCLQAEINEYKSLKKKYAFEYTKLKNYKTNLQRMVKELSKKIQVGEDKIQIFQGTISLCRIILTDTHHV